MRSRKGENREELKRIGIDMSRIRKVGEDVIEKRDNKKRNINLYFNEYYLDLVN